MGYINIMFVIIIIIVIIIVIIMVIIGESASQNATAHTDNVRQWLQLIRDENAFSSQDLLSSASDTCSCPDTSTATSQNTLRTGGAQGDEVQLVGARESTAVVAQDHSDEDRNVSSGSLGGDVQHYVVTHSVYQELASGESIFIY